MLSSAAKKSRRLWKKGEITAARAKRPRRKTSFGLVTLILIGLVFYANSSRLRLIWVMYQEKLQLQQQVAALKAENENLEQKVTQMQDTAWIEQFAREELGLVKPGDIVYIPVVSKETSAVDNKGPD